MRRLSRWLFRIPFVRSRSTRPASVRRSPRLGLLPLEGREQPGSFLDGFLLAAFGGVSGEPLSTVQQVGGSAGWPALAKSEFSTDSRSSLPIGDEPDRGSVGSVPADEGERQASAVAEPWIPAGVGLRTPADIDDWEDDPGTVGVYVAGGGYGSWTLPAVGGDELGFAGNRTSFSSLDPATAREASHSEAAWGPSNPKAAAASKPKGGEELPTEPQAALMSVPANPDTPVNTSTANGQIRPAIASDADGNFVVTWTSNGTDGSGDGIYAQRFASDGTALGSEFRVNTYTTSNQRYSSIAMDVDGDFVIAWESNQGESPFVHNVYAQRFSANGSTVGSEFRVNTYTTGGQQNASAAMDSSGNFVITWDCDSFQDGDLSGIFGQRYSADGTAQGSEFRVNTYTTGGQFEPSVGMDAVGNFVVTWYGVGSEPGSTLGVYAQRYAANGSAQGSEFRVNSYTTGDQGSPSVAMDANGNFAVVWTSGGQDGSGHGVYGQRYSANGTTLGSEFRANTYTTNGQNSPAIAMDAKGNFVVTWDSDGQDGNQLGVYAKRYAADGTVQGSEFRLNNYTTGQQSTPAVAIDSSGSFVVAWNGEGGSDSLGIYMAGNSIWNQAPTVKVPGDQSTTVGTSRVFNSANGNLISISDPDAGSSSLLVNVSVDTGVLTLSTTAGLGFSVGDGTEDSAMAFSGTLANINAAFDGLSFIPYIPDANYVGGAVLQIQVNDQGNTGAGGSKYGYGNVNISVAPSISQPTPSNDTQPTNGPVKAFAPDTYTSPGLSVASNAGNEPYNPHSFSSGPVRYADGTARLEFTDLWSDGFGSGWGASRAWTNGLGYDTNQANGNGVVDAVMPRLLQDSGSSNTITAILDGTNALFFDLSGGNYTARFFGQQKLTYTLGTDTFTLADTTGTVWTFDGFNGATSERHGQFVSKIEPSGVKTEVKTRHLTTGRITEIERTGAGSSPVESWVYTYISGGTNDGLLASIKLRSKNFGGSYADVRTVAYDYYGVSDANGNPGDLKTATIKDSAGTTIDTKYYRYYVSTGAGGYLGGLKFVFEPESYDRLVAGLGSGVGALSDAQVLSYADIKFEYDASGRVTKEVVQGDGCSVCAAGLGIYTFAYTASVNADSVNRWKNKTVETLPDGNQNIVYTNAYGQVMLSAFRDSTTSQEWSTFYQYDGAGRVVRVAAPSAVSGYNDSYADLLNWDGDDYQHLRDSAGLISLVGYGTSTTAGSTSPGDVSGYRTYTAVARGESGSPSLQSYEQYFSRTSGSNSIYPIANSTTYRHELGLGAETTRYAYAWQGSSLQPESISTSAPIVTVGQNGPGTAAVSTVVFDANGYPVWRKDPDGFLSYTEFDLKTGSAVKQITDVDTSKTATFTGLPSGWTTPAGGKAHLTSTAEVDGLGRTTKATDPNGSVTYTIFKDSAHEVRIYAGWLSGSNVPTGPTIVMRDDRSGGYTETLTMSAAPNVVSAKPTGAEAISSVQSLSRAYRLISGQYTKSDAYFDLTGITYSTSIALGTSGTNYYRTQQEYDVRGRPNRSQSPSGTIYRTEYDSLGRVASEWVGTDDTPTSNPWSPTNLAGTNMVKVREYEYDGGGVGDSNLSKVTEFPGLSGASRVTQIWYDWRNRPVATKAGVEGSESTSLNRPILYTAYDNLSRPISSETYDGDTVTPTDGNSDGIPDRPSASLLRAKSTAEYDAWGRAFRTTVWSVNPANGAVGRYGLMTGTWYDLRGNPIKVAAPGGLIQKATYDGAGRLVGTYATDGAGDSTWADAASVSDDIVLTQTGLYLDANGNTLMATRRDRFHDAVGTGELSRPTFGVKARWSFEVAYYDKLNRVTDTVNIGTNGGSNYNWLASVPSRSDTALVTSYAYDAAGLLKDVTDPRGLVSRTTYDAMGRATKTVQNYVNGVVSDTDDKTTRYAYGPSGMTSMTVDLTGGGVQTTEWVYGVSTGSGLVSNDIVGVTKWPDPSSGAASSGQQESRTVNTLGQVATATDRNGNVHTYSYDVLGRIVGDVITTVGSGVDGAVRRIEYAYDGQGNAYLVTQYDATTSGNIVTQVKREFNGFGQLIAEWQSHSGAVTGSTPVTRYAYSETAGGANHSRLASFTYPNGRVLTYRYATGVDNTISRLSSLEDATGVLETYQYLGLGTVVVRGHPQTGVDLTYVKLVAESNTDGGDQYTGLDRFGRVIDQRWLKSGTAVERFKYGYDRDSNVLWRDNLVDATFGEVYTYDGLNQIASSTRGTLNGTKTGVTGSPTRSQSWDYDAAGNFDGVTTNGTTQSRTANKQNEIASIGGATTPTYDSNGNMTGDETGRAFKYDAWNRLVEVRATSGGTVLVTYKYDGFGRRASETRSGTTTDLYYTAGWQVIEERVGGTPRTQYTWSPVYVDALVLRDRDADANGSLEERLWAVHDANYNVSALVDGSGTVVERFAYDTYGAVTVLNANFTTKSGGTGYDWTVLYQGMVWDGATGLYGSSRLRGSGYSPTLGRWMTNDPGGYAMGDVNLYRFEGNAPVGTLDAWGLQSNPERWHWHHVIPAKLFNEFGIVPNPNDEWNGINLREKNHVEPDGIHAKRGLPEDAYTRDVRTRLNQLKKANGGSLTNAHLLQVVDEIKASKGIFKKYSYAFQGPDATLTVTKTYYDVNPSRAQEIRPRSMPLAAAVSQQTRNLGRSIVAKAGRLVPFVSSVVVLLGWKQNVQASGATSGTYATAIDASPMGNLKTLLELFIFGRNDIKAAASAIDNSLAPVNHGNPLRFTPGISQSEFEGLPENQQDAIRRLNNNPPSIGSLP